MVCRYYKNYEKFVGAFGPSIDIFVPTGKIEDGLGSDRWIISPGFTVGLMASDMIQFFPILSYQYAGKPVSDNIKPAIVYQRTERGEDLLRAGAAVLGQVARRLLPLIDGRRRVADLPETVRPGDLEAAITELQTEGLIRFTGRDDSQTEADLRARSEAQLGELVLLKSKLAGLFTREMGKSGEIWDARVSDCVSLDVLRRVLREAIDVAYFRSGAAVARSIVDAVRPIFRNRRRP